MSSRVVPSHTTGFNSTPKIYQNQYNPTYLGKRRTRFTPAPTPAMGESHVALGGLQMTQLDCRSNETTQVSSSTVPGCIPRGSTIRPWFVPHQASPSPNGWRAAYFIAQLQNMVMSIWMDSMLSRVRSISSSRRSNRAFTLLISSALGGTAA